MPKEIKRRVKKRKVKYLWSKYWAHTRRLELTMYVCVCVQVWGWHKGSSSVTLHPRHQESISQLNSGPDMTSKFVLGTPSLPSTDSCHAFLAFLWVLGLNWFSCFHGKCFAVNYPALPDLCFWETVSLFRPGWLWIHEDLPAFASQVWGLKVCTTMHG